MTTCCICLPLLSCPGAEVHTATFNDGPDNWLYQGQGAGQVVDDAVRFQFSMQGMPLPETGAWVAGGAASGGAFIGDYPAAGIGQIGFHFLAESQLPSMLKLEWRDGVVVYFRDLKNYIQATGVWYSVVVSLQSRAAGNWVGTADEVIYEQTLGGVTQVAVRVSRTGAAAQGYRLDNFFVGHRAEAASMTISDGSVSLGWSALRPNFTYHVQGAVALTGEWTHVTTWFAGNTLDVVIDPAAATNAVRFYRLVLEEIHAP